jgi:hypothetical protein
VGSLFAARPRGRKKPPFRTPAEAAQWMREWAATLTYERENLEAAAAILEALTPARCEVQILDNLNDALAKHSEYWPGYNTVKGYLERVRKAWA